VGTRYGARLHLGGPGGIARAAAMTLAGPGSAGSRVAGAADFDGDGHADVVVASPNVGASIYRGSPHGLSGTPVARLLDTGGGYAQSIAVAGDVDGDGRSELLVGGADLVDVFSFAGAPGGRRLARLVRPPGRGERFGEATAGAGDVNGDGWDDVIVGAPGASMALVFHGGPAGLASDAAPAAVLTGAPRNEFGFAVAGVGDVDGDHDADVAIGARAAATAFIYHGSSAGLGSKPAAELSGSPSAGSALACLTAP
jgi:hypothetical protein